MKTGDVVKHGPSGEEWVVAYVDGDRLAPCGWPPGEAKVADCTLLESASDAEELALLQRLAQGGGDSSDRRMRFAQDELRKRGLLPPLPLTDREKVALLLTALKVAMGKNGHFSLCLAGQRGYGECSMVCEAFNDAIAKAEGKS